MELVKTGEKKGGEEKNANLLLAEKTEPHWRPAALRVRA